MELLMEYLSGLGAFLIYFGTGVASVVVYFLVYTRVTPHNELALIKENNVAAAVAAIGSLIGFVLPVTSVMAGAIDIVDCILWSIVAMVVQLLSYMVVRFLLMPRISSRIEAGELAAGLTLGGVSLAAGLLNAAAMST